MTNSLPAPRISEAGKAAFDAFLHKHVSSGTYPAIHLGVIAAQGDPLYFAYGGDKVLGQEGPVDEDTWIQMYSMTKLVTTVAVLQLVEAGKVDLDSPGFLAATCPDLAGLPVLESITDGTPNLAPRTTSLTVRSLLTHTSGLAYTFTSELIPAYHKATGSPSHWASTLEGYCAPLVFQPGTQWKYGLGIDWAGVVVERVTGQRLSEYMSEHIFKPLGIDHLMSFIPTPDVVDRLQACCTRDEAGKLILAPPGPMSLDPDEVRASQLSGGGGLYGTSLGYLRFLQGILAAQAPGGILSPASVAELFTDSLPARNGKNNVHSGVKEMLQTRLWMDPEHAANNAQHLGHSVGLLVILKDSIHGPRAGSGTWGGAANTQYWLDPTTGIAGIGFTQIFSLTATTLQAAEPFMGEVYATYQRMVYDALE